MKIYSELAFNIINNLLRIKKDDVISISGEINNRKNCEKELIEIPLIEELAVAIRKRQAFPILEITTTNLQDRFYNEMPDNIYSLPPSYYKKWIEMIDGFIEIGWQKFSNDFNETSSQQSQEMTDSTNELLEKIFEDNKKIIFLNLPNLQLAEYLQKDYQKLVSIYSDAVNCDYRYLNKTGIELKDKYFSSANYKIENVTELLEFKIVKDEASINSGNQSDSSLIILPAGFIEFPLIRKSLNGIINFERVYYHHHLFENIKIFFENGTIRYITFKVERKENFILQNALMNSTNNCLLCIGFNPEIGTFTNYNIYDRCINENITFNFLCEDESNIFLSTKNGKIERAIK
ncbi:MAG: hypothetical protein KAS49_01155 [Candidatus Cloacimonetes bacterium]|nr:hypothetical protein [Candidatus Cloacimonadota bacterium]